MSTTSAQVGQRAVADRSQIATPLVAILALGLIVRLLFLGSDGFHNDLAAFESWTLTLKDNPPWAFYAKTGFADYPPGYFVVLWVLAKLYALLPGAAGDAQHGWALLKVLVKLPAIAMDLVDAALVYAIVRRYAARSVALLAAALLAFNPAAIFVSSYWGQVDSISWGLVLAALWLVLRAGDDERKTVPRLVWAWLAFAFSLLIKPQAATVGLLFVAYPFATTDAAVRLRRLAGTGAGMLAALALAYGAGALFGAGANPVHVLGWLLGRYTFGSGVYPYNTVNAFNLYALRQPFWQPDSQPLTFFGQALGSLSLWGIVLVVASTALVVGRYLQRRDDRALIEGATIVALAFFTLATRMHERYVYGAFLLAMPLLAFGRAGLWAAVTLSATTYLNLVYSFAYQSAMETHAQVDATNLWPLVSHPAALANVVLFFYLGWRYLGGTQTEAQGETSLGDLAIAVPAEAGGSGIGAFAAGVAAKLRGWFDPREGIARLTRTDWLFMGGFVVVAFVVAVVNLAWPAEKIFDEVYFARAGEEYLKAVPQFEWTHPPFTKLVIAVSIALFGDNSFGWRFLNVVIGSLQIAVIYAFAKRLTSSTPFAALAALLLIFDGFHFVEQRISTGEITISTLILIVLYSFYRYWLAAQVRIERLVRKPFGLPFVATMLAGLPLAAGFAWLVNLAPPDHTTPIANGIWPAQPGSADMASFGGAAHEVAFLYVMVGVYLVARLLVPKLLPAAGERVSYADGSLVDLSQPGKPVVTPPPRAADGEELAVTYGRDGTMRYATPAARAEFAPGGELRVDGELASSARSAKLWLGVLAVSIGLLAASKWNGAFDFAIVFAVLGLVWSQRFLKTRALYGNPYGFPLDVVVALLLFVPATIYGLAYIPTFVLGGGHNLTDLMALQWQMYNYHSHVTGTHPYMSVAWQWPIMQIPISYYYHDFRTGAAINDAAACCVAEILALPNPLVFLLGLVSVPFVGWLAWRERNKGYALLVVAYFVQWLPWFHSPRMLFEYHFFPNLALIVLCDVVLIQHVLRRFEARRANWYLGSYAAAVVLMFAFFYPVLAGSQMSYASWHARMWPDVLGIPNTSWIIPHR
jgi:dolichyl-phosphate-mannose--protein O-mannosyl transferase